MIDRTLKHYRVIATLGTGGMDEVYLAQDTKLDRRVAEGLACRTLIAYANRSNRSKTLGNTESSGREQRMREIVEELR